MLRKKITAIAAVAAAVFSLALTANAEGSGTTLESSMTTVSTSLISSIQSVVNSMVSFIGSALPVILIIVGSVLLITFGLKFFKKFTK
uniref:Uncharacterized protein n=1 Tax=Dulem virus 51 TaxID=3145762 RepID=A0AAU8AV83_9VIRU